MNEWPIYDKILPKWLLCLCLRGKPGSCVNLAMGQHGGRVESWPGKPKLKQFHRQNKMPILVPILVDPLWQIKHFLGQEWETKRPLSTNNYDYKKYSVSLPLGRLR
jgi:hypothetical protein